MTTHKHTQKRMKMPRQQKYKPEKPDDKGTINSHNSEREFTNTDLQEIQEGKFQILIFNIIKGLTLTIQEMKETETLIKTQKEA